MRLARIAAAALLALGAGLVIPPSPARAAITHKLNDYNGDGISDIVAVRLVDDCLYRWNGVAGGGGFTSRALVGCGWGNFKYALSAPGDLNRDGIGDLVSVDNRDGCMYRWLGTGNGGFGAATRFGCGWDLFWRGLHGAGDLNNDGNGDLIMVRDENGCLFRAFGDGNGGFGPRERINCEYRNFAATMTGAGDITGDGNADLVAANEGDEPNACLFRWEGDGQGGFRSFAQIGCGWAPYTVIANISGMGDLNGDGRGDLVAVDTDDGVLRGWHGTGTGFYGPAVTYGEGWDNYFLAT
jgi:hypothetical protein